MSIISKLGKKNVSDLLVSLMKIESTTGNEGTLCKELKQYMEDNNWVVYEQPMKNNEKRNNLLITRKGVNVKDIKILFNSHLDTVPPYIPPRVENGIIYGRGANDAKGQVAAMIVAGEKLIEENENLGKNIGFLFVVGEETDHIGMITANELNLQPDYMIIGEPTENIFGSLQKGAAKLEIHCTGIPAHSGYPEKGISAIEKLLDILNDIRNYNWPKNEIVGNTTCNIGFIKGGQALNALAGEASAQLMFRITTSVEDITSKLASIVGEKGEIKVFGSNEPVQLSSPPLGYKSQSVSFNTDLPYFKNKDKLKGVYLYGGGSITNAHSENEYIKIDDLEEAVKTYVTLAKYFLSS
ncbi:Peptidase M20 family and Peptidase M20, dimerisation domain-containing protein [Strongyloides ratti]|uniref:Peptidase M20 family and Peptidase M20, dimerisation domain-containing protein n=1 Tax=Strongyloides ratti TaxID=34506 RepID=A0A090LEL7_STRRB|nr:Peptidase M20 family and Peptidase M20, dimerisation domain-containing protein [Strongyloides ratti]CEF68191.1 Peptidase M20 family and Peptidase M20, dimerisation domain-containing protein [Strongyloides ratti]